MRLFADLSNLSALQQSAIYELYVKASNIAGTSGESNVVEYDHRDRVAAPSLSISSLSLNTNTLYIGDNATDAEAFDIYVDGVYATTMTVIYPIAVRCDNGAYSGSTSLNVNGTATVTLSANTNYALPTAISVTNASYTYDSTTGVVVLSNPTGNVSITAICTFIPQLDAPTNVSVSGTTATFDEVENAESYEFFVDGTSIGEYSSGVDLTGTVWVFNSDFEAYVEDVPTIPEYQHFAFSSDGQTYDTMDIADYGLLYYENGTSVYQEVYNSGWNKNAYKTITILEAGDDSLLGWLETYATQQS